jgi:hypothetical protein
MYEGKRNSMEKNLAVKAAYIGEHVSASQDREEEKKSFGISTREI